MTPVLSDVPLLNSRAYVASTLPFPHLLIIIHPVHSAENAWAHPAKRESSCRAYIRLQTLFQGIHEGVEECVGAWGTFGDRRQPPSLHHSLPAKGILCGSQFRAIYPWLRAIQRRERGKEDRDRNNDILETLETFRFEWPKSFVPRFVEEGIPVWKCLALIVRGLARWCDGWRVCRACGEEFQVISVITLPVIVWRSLSGVRKRIRFEELG